MKAGGMCFFSTDAHSWATSTTSRFHLTAVPPRVPQILHVRSKKKQAACWSSSPAWSAVTSSWTHPQQTSPHVHGAYYFSWSLYFSKCNHHCHHPSDLEITNPCPYLISHLQCHPSHSNRQILPILPSKCSVLLSCPFSSIFSPTGQGPHHVSCGARRDSKRLFRLVPSSLLSGCQKDPPLPQIWPSHSPLFNLAGVLLHLPLWFPKETYIEAQGINFQWLL